MCPLRILISFVGSQYTYDTRTLKQPMLHHYNSNDLDSAFVRKLLTLERPISGKLQ
jgi:hypothetical protein